MSSKMGYFNGMLNKDKTIQYTHIRIKDVVEVFQDYKKSALLISMCECDWKCCKEAGVDICMCQNQPIAKQKDINISFYSLLNKIKKSMTDAIIFGGLEPLLQIDEIYNFIRFLRKNGVKKDIVIYTGYYLEEIDGDTIANLAKFNVILKCGRFIPNDVPKYDEVLGINLASSNQYGVYLTYDNIVE